jgi:hypothetical protein
MKYATDVPAMPAPMTTASMSIASFMPRYDRGRRKISRDIAPWRASGRALQSATPWRTTGMQMKIGGQLMRLVSQ